MSSEQEGVDGLPSAAYSFVVEEAELDPDENHRVVKFSDPRETHSIEGIRHKEHTITELHELVRRKDAEDAVQQREEHERQRIIGKIQERLEQAEEKVEKYNGLHRLNLNDAKARREELKTLLHEVEK